MWILLLFIFNFNTQALAYTGKTYYAHEISPSGTVSRKESVYFEFYLKIGKPTVLTSIDGIGVSGSHIFLTYAYVAKLRTYDLKSKDINAQVQLNGAGKISKITFSYPMDSIKVVVYN